MYFSNFLHFYQPPTQKKEILDRVARESYRPVFAGLLKIPQAHLTINFSSCLTELLDRHGHQDIIKMIRKLLQNGQIELTASAKFHALLPKLPKEEVIRQIKMDRETNGHYFGSAYVKAMAGQGFFPPEMAFDLNLAQIVSEMGFKWLILDEYSYPNQCQWDKVYQVKGLPLQVYFRERGISFKILSAQLGTAKMLIKELGQDLNPHRYLLTAMDGETFGHHRPGLEEMLFEIFRSKSFTTLKVSELSQYFPEEEVVPRPSTWALMRKDLERDIPFARWDDPDNQIHHWQWELTNMALKVASSLPEDFGARQLLDRAVHSDQFWWASAKPWWSIEYIEAGAKELLEVIKAAPNVSKEERIHAGDLYLKIVTTAFDWQRTGKVAKMAKEEDEEIRQRTEEKVFRVDKKEIVKMINLVNEQMLAAAKHKEYERAAQLRERIGELKGYLK